MYTFYQQKFFSSKQDTKIIQDQIKKDFNVSDLNWIGFGGSYSGVVSALHRIKYPERFYAAFASSAPLNAQYDGYKYFDQFGLVFNDTAIGGSPVKFNLQWSIFPQGCLKRIKEAFSKVDMLIGNESNVILSDFNFCPVNLQDLKEKQDFLENYKIIDGPSETI